MSTLEMEQEIERVLLETRCSNAWTNRKQAIRAARNSAPLRQPQKAKAKYAAATDEQNLVPETPADIDDDRWSQDAGTSGGGRDEEDDREAQDTHAGTVSL